MSNILIGVSGGIAAYKACGLVREFKKRGDSVKVIMTKNGARFVSPLTFETLSGNPVYTETFADYGAHSPEHIALSKWADVLVTAPATANILAKFANGIADDLLSTEYLAFRKKTVVAPSMNDAMYAHPAVVKNIQTLKKRGVFVVEPQYGELACGDEGKGRLAPIELIVSAVDRCLEPADTLKGKRVIVTGGALFEHIDPVRVVSNRSSGRMAKEFAEAAYRLKAERVILIHAEMAAGLPFVSDNIYAPTAQEMLEALKREADNADLLVMAAAVSDYLPDYSSEKIKKNDLISLKMSRNIDILSEIKDYKIKKVGFALETENGEDNAVEKMKRKALHYIVLNGPSNLGSSDGECTVFSAEGEREEIKSTTKREIAERVLKWIKF